MEDVRGRADVAEHKADEANRFATLADSKADNALGVATAATDRLNYVAEQMGDVETALDGIIAIQNALMGGDGE